MSFVCRTVFIYSLGKTYLGFNGLFSDILSLLSLAELGVGTAILYSMYKPAAQGDHKKVAALLNLYKRVYNSIGIVITAVGLCLTPFLKYLISDVPDMREVPIIYILYLLNTTASYFFVYKKSILIIVTCLGINIFYIAVFIKTDEFKYFWGILKARIVRLKPNGEKK